MPFLSHVFNNTSVEIFTRDFRTQSERIMCLKINSVIAWCTMRASRPVGDIVLITVKGLINFPCWNLINRTTEIYLPLAATAKRRRYWIGRLVQRPKRLIRFRAMPYSKLQTRKWLARGGGRARTVFTAIKISRRVVAVSENLMEIIKRQW